MILRRDKGSLQISNMLFQSAATAHMIPAFFQVPVNQSQWFYINSNDTK